MDDHVTSSSDYQDHGVQRQFKKQSTKSIDKPLNENLIASDDPISVSAISSDRDRVGLLESDTVEPFEIEDVSTPNGHSSNDMKSNESIKGEANTSHAFWNLNKCFVGAASFALPWAVSKTGIVAAVIGFAFLSMFSLLTFRWMLIASHFAPGNAKPTYPELAEIAFSHLFPTTNAMHSDHQNGENNGFIAMRRNNDDQKVQNGNDDVIENEMYSVMNGQNAGNLCAVCSQ